MLRALRLGYLRAHFSSELEAQDIPGWAWVGAEHIEHVFFEGRLPLDVFLPDDWQSWSCHLVFLCRNAFESWMDQSDLTSTEGLAQLPPPFDERKRPGPITYRLPPEQPFVALSEALTWIAFEISMDQGRLCDALASHTFGERKPRPALEQAVAKLTALASGGLVSMRGKYLEGHLTNEDSVLTTPIDAVRFEGFAQFNSLYDGLSYGKGLTWDIGGGLTGREFGKGRADAYRKVTVNRANLLKHFPPRLDASRALLAALPAALPDIGPVMGLAEAVSWVAYGMPSNDVEIWDNLAGEWVFRFTSGQEVPKLKSADIPEYLTIARDANRSIWTALCDATCALMWLLRGSRLSRFHDFIGTAGRPIVWI